MSLLIKAAKITDPNSPHNGKVRDILIEKGKITALKNNISAPSIKSFNAKNKYVSPGWFDMNVNFSDPGFEYKEDLLSGSSAAANGGFTGVACMPNTQPPLDSKSQIEYIKKSTTGNIVEVFPIGTISKKREGNELTEIYDLANSGAVAFSDGNKPVANAGLFLRALLYVKAFNGLVISNPYEQSLSLNGNINEGVISTKIGLKGIPAIAEEIMVKRDLYIAEYTESRLHFSNISTKKSVELIREAKKNGLQVSAEVSIHHLIYDDTFLEKFDTNYKMLPPLRTKEDIKELINGIKDGTLDVISSNHTPHEEELKKCEFEHAAFGIIGLETLFSLYNSNLNKVIPLSKFIKAIAINPRKILNMEVPLISEGANANLTIYDTSKKWTYTEKDICSKSKNTPFISTAFKGKPTAVYNNNKFLEVKN